MPVEKPKCLCFQFPWEAAIRDERIDVAVHKLVTEGLQSALKEAGVCDHAAGYFFGALLAASVTAWVLEFEATNPASLSPENREQFRDLTTEAFEAIVDYAKQRIDQMLSTPETTA